jgi:hypothetical protein
MVNSLAPLDVPFNKKGVDWGCKKYPINNIPKFAKNKNTMRTRIKKANLATIEFDVKNSLLPFTETLDPNSFNDCFTFDAVDDTLFDTDCAAPAAEFDIVFKNSGIFEELDFACGSKVLIYQYI